MTEQVPYRIDCGSAVDVIDINGNLWHQDSIYLVGSSVITPPPDTGTFIRPGSADSLWYRKVADTIAAGAFYGTGDGSTNPPGITPATSWDIDPEYIFQGSLSFPAQELWTTNSWPAVNVGGTDTGKAVRINPSIYVPTYNHGVISPTGYTYSQPGGYLDPTGATWTPYNGFSRDPVPSDGSAPPAGAPASGLPYAGNLYPDLPMSSRMTTGGRGASGLSAIAGSLRPGELEGAVPIAHAIRFTAPMHAYGRPNLGFNGGNGYTTPATKADSYWATGYTGTAFWLGSLLAVRPQDWAALDATLTTTQGHNLALCLRDYGGYVAEDSSFVRPTETAWLLEMDSAATGTAHALDTAVVADLNRILPLLYVVMNNAPPI